VKRALLLCLLLSGCASYNAMYKANRYAGEARRLDAEGRSLEAGGYWGRASVKAESLLVHQPNGKYSANALAIRGEALAAANQCSAAARILPGAIAQLTKADEREYATLALATCQLTQGAPALAAATVEPVTESSDDTRRRQALLVLGTAERQLGNDSASIVALHRIPGTRALIQRTLAYAALPDDPAATSAFDSLVALRDSMLPWDSLLTISGRTNPLLASQLTYTLARSKTLSPERSVGFLFADAKRLGAVDTALQRQRYDEIIQMAGPGPQADQARFDLMRMRLVAADSMADVMAVLESIQTLEASDGSVTSSVAPLRRQIMVLQQLMDSAAPGEPRGDMRRFLAAEFSRDTLGARRLAANIFGSIPAGWPDSPYAAKAWLAGRQLTGDTSAASAQYAASPYLAVLRGEDPATYTQLEDSLANFARQLAAGSRPATVAPNGAAKRPDGIVDPEDDAPNARRRQPRRPAGARTTQPGTTAPAAGVVE
jgi:hypothetical protein